DPLVPPVPVAALESFSAPESLSPEASSELPEHALANACTSTNDTRPNPNRSSIVMICSVGAPPQASHLEVGQPREAPQICPQWNLPPTAAGGPNAKQWHPVGPRAPSDST